MSKQNINLLTLESLSKVFPDAAGSLWAGVRWNHQHFIESNQHMVTTKNCCVQYSIFTKKKKIFSFISFLIISCIFLFLRRPLEVGFEWSILRKFSDKLYKSIFLEYIWVKSQFIQFQANTIYHQRYTLCSSYQFHFYFIRTAYDERSTSYVLSVSIYCSK